MGKNSYLPQRPLQQITMEQRLQPLPINDRTPPTALEALQTTLGKSSKPTSLTKDTSKPLFLIQLTYLCLPQWTDFQK